MKAFLNSLLSRKFLAAIGAAAVAVSQKQYDLAVGVIGAWILAEAHVDAKAAVAQVEQHVSATADATVSAAGDPRFQ